VTTRSFGKLPDGRTARLFTLTSASGFQAEISDFGGTVVRLFAPDRTGRLVDVVLGFDSVERYPAESPHFGAIIGRVGNRIAGGKFSLGAKTYSLATNNSPDGIPCHLHGGNVGFDKILWSVNLHFVSATRAQTVKRVTPASFPPKSPIRSPPFKVFASITGPRRIKARPSISPTTLISISPAPAMATCSTTKSRFAPPASLRSTPA